MFSIIIKKNQGDAFPYGLNEIIRTYIKLFGQNDVLIACPGYQSTTKPRIDDLCKELKRIAPKNKIFFANGMNGHLPEFYTGKTIHQCHVPTIDPMVFGGLDHSKCILFADGASFKNKTARIKALLIGSSNISYNTYINANKFAPKGELDVFLLSEEEIGLEDFRRIRDCASDSMCIKNKGSERNIRCIYSKTLDDENYRDSEIFNSFLGDFSELLEFKDYQPNPDEEVFE